MQMNNPLDMSQLAPLTEEQEIYKENIIDHYKHPHNKGRLAEHTHSHKAVNPLCGDHIVMYLYMKDDVVVDISFEGDGCAISQASASLLTDELKGKTSAEVITFTEQDLYTLLGIPISHTRRKCALLSLKTVQGAINNTN